MLALARSASARTIAAAAPLRASSILSRRAISTANYFAKEPESAYEPPSPKHSYLQDLLQADDAHAPWNKQPVEIVSREVQSLSSVPESWHN
ncbi:hypothetical protein GGI12_002844 [Dipsacomyces acuminosporus]|nr:hypothetical protein GGI12_002844 [Dipsacomyces acuminosporus]